MNVRQIITDAINDGAFRSDRTLSDCILDALRAAGGADRVVLDWSGTPCADCDGYGVVHSLTCSTCGGSGSGDDVVLHGLDRPVSVYEKHTFPDGTHQMAPRYDLWEPVPVTPVTPSEATE